MRGVALRMYHSSHLSMVLSRLMRQLLLLLIRLTRLSVILDVCNMLIHHHVNRIRYVITCSVLSRVLIRHLSSMPLVLMSLTSIHSLITRIRILVRINCVSKSYWYD